MTAGDKPDLLVVCHAAPFLLADLAVDHRLHNLFLAEDKEALLADVGGRIRAILAGGMQGPDAALIARLPKLEIIASNSVGFDATDVAAANARGVIVTHTPDVLTDDVADLGMAFIIMAPRRIAATAVSRLPWPEMTSTGIEGSRRLISSSSSRPSRREPCSQTSSSTSDGRRVAIASSAASLSAAERVS